MKKILSLFIVAFLSFTFVKAQNINPVTYTYESKSKGNNTYDLIITATIANTWHLYSQNSDAEGPVPTKITFNKNPLVTIQGKTAETGSIIKSYDKDLKANVSYYSNKVVFTQTVKLKANVKTVVTGNIEYMVCDDKRCLPPKTIPFKINIM